MTMFTFADTTTMPFDELPTNPGLKFQLLWKDPPTGSTVQMSYGPPGFSSTIVEMLSHGPHRHYHRNVNERHYILGGDYPIWHWPNDRDEGTMTILRRHTFLENPAKTLHGLFDRARCPWRITVGVLHHVAPSALSGSQKSAVRCAPTASTSTRAVCRLAR